MFAVYYDNVYMFSGNDLGKILDIVNSTLSDKVSEIKIKIHKENE